MKKIVSKIISVFLVVVLLLAVAILVLVGYNNKKGKATIVMGYSFMAVQTGSMVPEYPIGSAVIVKVCDASELKVGDVISFYTFDPTIRGKIVTHRIKEVYKTKDGIISFITKGDANVVADTYPVDADKVIGKVIGKSNAIEKIVKIRSNNTTFFLLIVVPVCIIIALEFISISKSMNSSGKSEKKDEEEKQ